MAYLMATTSNAIPNQRAGHVPCDDRQDIHQPRCINHIERPFPPGLLQQQGIQHSPSIDLPQKHCCMRTRTLWHCTVHPWYGLSALG